MTSPRALWTAFAALALFKVWLAAAVPFAAVSAQHDDLLFHDLAAAAAAGDWLGPYGVRTLVKGPGYPLFIATAYSFSLSLRVAQELLYVAFCAVALMAVGPLGLRAGVRLALGALLLFNPMTHAGGIAGRLVREGIYPALAGLVLACAIGVHLRRKGSLGTLGGWSAALGAALGSAWVTREEGVWLLPAVGALALGAALGARGRSRPVARAAAIVLPALAVWALVVGGVRVVNGRVYGWPVVVELQAPEFRAGYGALARVGPEPPVYVPVTAEAWRQAGRVSPAAASLVPHLEDALDVYEKTTCRWLPEACGHVGGGWFVWMLRDAADKAGHHGTAAEARAFYRRLAEEVNAACAARRLGCRPRRDSLAPAWRWGQVPAMARACGRGLFRVATFGGWREEAMASRARGLRKRYQRLTLSRAAAEEGAPAQPMALLALRDRLRTASAALYAVLGPVLLAAGLLALGLRAARRRADDGALALAALALAVVTRLALLALVDATSFRTMSSIYLSPLEPLLLLLGGLGAALLAPSRTMAGPPRAEGAPSPAG
ncbi:MAG TPA: hypothetical protein VII13_17165 [Vicinamibacteria bacterium]